MVAYLYLYQSHMAHLKNKIYNFPPFSSDITGHQLKMSVFPQAHFYPQTVKPVGSPLVAAEVTPAEQRAPQPANKHT